MSKWAFRTREKSLARDGSGRNGRWRKGQAHPSRKGSEPGLPERRREDHQWLAPVVRVKVMLPVSGGVAESVAVTVKV